jgi:hypothetical protein
MVLAALQTAADGGASGTNGFHDVTRYLDVLITYVIYLAIPLGALGFIAAGAQLISGNPDGSTTMVRTVAGVGVVLLAKGIMS